MALFDAGQQRMCVRIVYDGAAGTGKTTNLAALCRLLATQHTTELYSPGEVEGRTLYFDWVQVLTGVICGFPVMCQIISVPGQTVLTPRRRHLLSTADAVVLVCDSTPVGIERAREGLDLLEEIAGARELPLVVQANKQDQVNALTGEECLERLGRAGGTVVEAIATEGIGVLDTFMSAFRAISRAMQAQNERGELHVPVGHAPLPAQIKARLDREEVDPEWAAEMFLEELQASFLDRDEPAPVTKRSGLPATTPLAPDSEVEAGFVWPAHTGRQVLAALAEAYQGERQVKLDAAGEATLAVHGYVLRTTRADRFTDREEARQALVRSARERTKLEGLLAPDTVLAAQAAADGALWLWTVRTTMPSLAQLDRDADVEDGEREPRRLKYVIALVDAVGVWLRHGFALRLEPASFGLHAGTVHHIGALGGPADEDALAAALGDAVAAVTSLGWDVRAFLATFEQELRVRLTSEEASRARAFTRFPTAHRVPAAGLTPVSGVD